MKMQIQLAVALSALFHTPKGRHSVWRVSGMIYLKIGKMAAKTEIEYQSANELDDPFDSSETRKLCESDLRKLCPHFFCWVGGGRRLPLGV